MKALWNISIISKISLIVGELVLVAGLLTCAGFYSIARYQDKAEEIQQASRRAILGEQVNSLILEIVMDSRGNLHGARPRAEAEHYGKPILANLIALEHRFSDWQALSPAEDAAAMEAAHALIGKFSTVRNRTGAPGRRRRQRRGAELWR